MYTIKEERNILQTIKGRNSNWIDHVLRRNCLEDTLLQEIYKKRKKWLKDEEDVSSNWMTWRRPEDTRGCKRTYQIAFAGKPALEQSMNLS